MPKTGRFTRYLHFGIDDELHATLRAEAARRGLPVANLVRDLLTYAMAEEAAVEGRDAIDRAVRRALKPAEERLARLIARAAMAAATAMYLNTQVIADTGKHDAVELYQQARKKAAIYLKEEGKGDGGGE